MVAVWDLKEGDCRETLRQLKVRGVKFDSCVCDPPYEIGFLSKKWDNTGIAFRPETWRAVYDVMKPGAYLVAFGGCRSHHRMWCAIEDAGFTIVDSLMWMFGSGMPKSHNVSLSIDKAQGVKRKIMKVITRRRPMIGHMDQVKAGAGQGWFVNPEIHMPDREPITDDAKQWRGFGSGLKPSYEPILLAIKPRDGTIVHNVLKHGVGALNIDACRVDTNDDLARVSNNSATWGTYGNGPNRAALEGITSRWPANIVHDGSDEVEAAFGLFGETQSSDAIRVNKATTQFGFGDGRPEGRLSGGFVDSGTVSRFFKSCKFTKEELRFLYTSKAGDDDRAWSRHTTVKPLELMHWLVRLVTPPGGTVVDPFCGSGTTVQAAVEQGFNAIGCEITPEYITDIERRMATFCGWYPRRDPFMPLSRRPLPVAPIKPERRSMPRSI